MQGKQQECVAGVEEGFSWVLVVASAHEAVIFCVSSVPTIPCGQNNGWAGENV